MLPNSTRAASRLHSIGEHGERPMGTTRCLFVQEETQLEALEGDDRLVE